MRVTTLKAGRSGVGGLLCYYEGLGQDRAVPAVGYYADPEEPPGRWWGSGCGAVGLEGDVRPGELAHMLQAQHPLTGAQLGRGYGDRSARAFDATFSAPKSVSALWALSPHETVRSHVLAAHDAAVDAALEWFERHGSVTRRGKDGVDQVDAAGVAVALFRQHTSRSMDPQLHTHAVVWAKVQDPSGRWLALDARFLLRQQRTIGWIYDAALRVELTRRLGLEWEALAPGAGQADLVGVPPGVREAFSQRAGQVDTKLAELVGRWRAENDGAEPDPQTLYVLERRAALASRPGKEHGRDPQGLRSEWAARARAVGFDPAGIGATAPPFHQLAPIACEAIVTEALTRLVDQSSTWMEADLAREIATLIPCRSIAHADDLLNAIDDFAAEAASRCIELHPAASADLSRRRDGRAVSEHVTDRALTTSEVLVQEEQLVAWATARLEAAPSLSKGDRQRAVADAIAGTGRMVLVVGPAGAGKTTAIRAGVEALNAQGRPVLGLAPSGKAADVLATTAGCPATTVATILYRHHTGQVLPEVGTTVVLDEAGMTRTNDLATLAGLAERNGWRLVCVGDPEQLPAVGRGGMFAHWCDTLRAHRLEQVHRFTEAWQAEASLALRRGDPVAAAAYVDHGRVATIHPALLASQVADQLMHVTARGEALAITTSTAATARAINIEVQRRLHLGEPPGQVVALADGTEVRVGDHVATRRNLSATITTDRGTGVRNRHTWDVTAIGPDGSLTAFNQDHGTVNLPSDYVARHVELGWAVTGYGNQGVTEDHGVCVIEAGSSRAGTYVGLTRGRGYNTAWILDPTGTADPEVALAAVIARPANATTALCMRDRLHSARGLDSPNAPENKQQVVGPTMPGLREPASGQADEVARMLRRLDEIQHREPPTRGLSL